MIRDLMVVLLELPDELMARLSICAASCIEIIESSPSQVVIVFHVVVVHLFENLFYSIRFADVLIRDFQHDIEYFVIRLFWSTRPRDFGSARTALDVGGRR